MGKGGLEAGKDGKVNRTGKGCGWVGHVTRESRGGGRGREREEDGRGKRTREGRRCVGYVTKVKKKGERRGRGKDAEGKGTMKERGWERKQDGKGMWM